MGGTKNWTDTEETAGLRASIHKLDEERFAYQRALEEILQTRGVLCQDECRASQRMVEIASAALGKYGKR
jgi:hypothetical protein